MTAMGEKKSAARFTIQFSETDPTHIQVVEILNRQGIRSKAQYIANAVLHYEHCDTVPQTPRPAVTDERLIETVVRRILEQRARSEPYPSAATPPQTENLDLDDITSALGADGLDAIFDALGSFRQ